MQSYFDEEAYWKDLEENGSFPHPSCCVTDSAALWAHQVWIKYDGRIEPDPNMPGTYRIKKSNKRLRVEPGAR